MKIAVPVSNGLLNMHFGHCESFAVLDVDMENKQILSREEVAAPPHEPGLLPRWLGEKGVNLVITGGMGQKAKQLFAVQGINVIVGAPVESPETLVQHYIGGVLQSGVNVCDH